MTYPLRSAATHSWLGRLLGALTLIALATTPLFAGKLPEMIVVKTPHFTVMTTGRAMKAQAWARHLERFRISLGSIIPVDESRLTPTVLVIFANDREMAAYMPSRKGQPTLLIGYFARTDGVNVVGLTADLEDASLVKPFVFHGATHWYTNASLHPLPVWLQEGLAEVFSTFTSDDESFTVGEAVKDHVQYLRRTAVPPPAQVVDWASHENGYDERKRTGPFYAGSWLLAHWALFDDQAAGLSRPARYMKALETAPDPEAAFKAAFGGDYKAVGTQAVLYSKAGRYSRVRLKLPAGELGLEEPRKATEAEVEYALGSLLLNSRDAAEGLPHLKRATELAPANPSGWEAVGFAQAGEGNQAEAFDAFNRAIEAGSKIGEVWSRRGWLRRDVEGITPASEPAELRPMAADFRRAIELDPRCDEAYHGLADIASRVAPADPDDVKRLEEGQKFSPKDDWIKVGLISLRIRAGAPGAVAEMKALLTANASLPTPIRRRAEDEVEAVKLKVITEHIESLRSEGQYAQLIVELDQALADEDISPRSKRRLQGARDETDQARRIVEAKEKLDTDRKDEGLAALRKLREEPSLSNSMRQAVEALLEKWQ